MTRRGKTTFSIVSMGLVAAAVLLSVFVTFHAAQSQTETATRGPYMLAAGDKLMVWRIDQSTGRVSYCMRDTQSTDPKYIISRGPYCSAWSP